MEKEKTQPTTAAATYTTTMQVMPQHPNTGNVHEMKLIGVIDQKAPALERTGGEQRGGEACVLPDSVKNAWLVALMPATLWKRVI